jgi:hypothetical protein
MSSQPPATNSNGQETSNQPGRHTRSVPVAGAARMGAILEMFDAGATLNEIGIEFGVSRERIRQLVQPHRPSRREVPRRKVLPPRPAPAEIAAALRATLDGYAPEPGSSLRALLKAFDPSPLLTSRATMAEKLPDDEFLDTWTHRLSCAATDCGEPLSRRVFDVWAAEQGQPSSQSALLRRWSWSELCEMAYGEVTGTE